MPVILTKNLQKKLDKIKLFNGIEKYINDYYKPVPFNTLKKIIIHCFSSPLDNIIGAAAKSSRGMLSIISDLVLRRPTGQTFSERLISLIKIKGMKPRDVYFKADITKQHFSKIKNNIDYQPAKGTAIAFALALNLNVEETNDLLRRAGYILSHSIKSDLIVEYFIKEKFYDVDEINIQLHAHGFTPLTNNREIKEKSTRRKKCNKLQNG